jgi:hypothetical protein
VSAIPAARDPFFQRQITHRADSFIDIKPVSNFQEDAAVGMGEWVANSIALLCAEEEE